MRYEAATTLLCVGMNSPKTHESEPGRSVLVVDDDPALLRMVRLMFRGRGFTVITASDGERGLAEAIERHPAAIILDLEMPRMDGWTFYRELRALSIDAPVVILSAYDARAAQRRLGADAYVAKPFDVDELVERVDALV